MGSDLGRWRATGRAGSAGAIERRAGRSRHARTSRADGPRPLAAARRGGHRRAGLARPPAAPAADDHLDPHPAGHHRACSSASTAQALAKVPGLIAAANPVARLLAAFVVFYLGFPLRGLRWAILLRGTGFTHRAEDSTEIIFLSWLVNCVVPAKLGDVYRAYLLKINSTVSLSRTFGTVFIERILDLFAIALLGLAAGYWSFRDGLPPTVQVVFAIGLVVVVVLARRAAHDAQLRAADHRPAAAAAPRHRALRPVRGGRLRRRRAAPAAGPRRR